MHEYWRFFAHYPSKAIGDDAVLTAQGDSTSLDTYIRTTLGSSPRGHEVGALLRFCGDRATPVNEICRAGYSLQAVLWAVKKGLCRLLS